MNRIKQILKGESIENLLDETILRIFGEGLIMSSDSEILSLIKLYYPNLFASRENKLLSLSSFILQDFTRTKYSKGTNF